MKNTEEIIKDVANEKIDLNYNLIETNFAKRIMDLKKDYENSKISYDMAKLFKTKAIKEYEQEKFLYEIYENSMKDYTKTTNLRVELRKLLNTDSEINDVLNTAIQLIELYSGESFT